MALPDDYTTLEAPPERPVRPRRRRGTSIRLSCGGMLLFVLLDLLVLGLVAWPLLQQRFHLPPLPTFFPATDTGQPPTQVRPSPSPSLTSSPSFTPISTSTVTPVSTAVALSTINIKNGLLILALSEGTDTHLFAYQPESLPFTRLNVGPWDDITPAISPDGNWVAFASNRNGYWDLYLLKLVTGEVFPLTDTLEYDAAPSWSPDSRWLAYESYQGDNLSIMILPLDGSQAPILLTENPAADFSPAWSPKGRQIAYISNRSGENEVWIFDLDQPTENINVSQNPSAQETHPTWFPDGSKLAWASVQMDDGYHGIVVWDATANEGLGTHTSALVGSGDWPLFSGDGQTLLTVLNSPNRAYLTAYGLQAPGLTLPLLEMPNAVRGITWADVPFPWPLPPIYRDAVMLTPTPVWEPVVTPVEGVPGGRSKVVPLPKDVSAPYAMLLDGVDESFLALRQHLGIEVGWDFLANLENAYIPLTTPLNPGVQDGWLYTGRGITVNSLPINAGWMAVVREDYGGETYWRIYLRSRFQDGSSGMPLHELPWDFNARFVGVASTYEAGGAQANSIPAGYWVDFTAQAMTFGWERLPALTRWQSALNMARFNEFVLTGGLDWNSAMLSLYPPEVLVTPTAIVPPTRTLSPTPRWYQTVTPTPTDTPRPTYTPIPSVTTTPTVTITPTVTFTPRPTRRPALKTPTPDNLP